MQLRILTLRYTDGLQGFPEDAITRAVAGREVLEVREHFYVHGNVPHLTLLLLIGDGPLPSKGKALPREDPGDQLPEELRPLYRQLRLWRNDRAKVEGVPSYVLFRNAQLAEICRRLPGTLAALREIEGVGEATCAKYGEDLLRMIPGSASEEKKKEGHAKAQRGEAR